MSAFGWISLLKGVVVSVVVVDGSDVLSNGSVFAIEVVGIVDSSSSVELVSVEVLVDSEDDVVCEEVVVEGIEGAVVVVDVVVVAAASVVFGAVVVVVITTATVVDGNFGITVVDLLTNGNTTLVGPVETEFKEAVVDFGLSKGIGACTNGFPIDLLFGDDPINLCFDNPNGKKSVFSSESDRCFSDSALSNPSKK